jgi:hypothetical protein
MSKEARKWPRQPSLRPSVRPPVESRDALATAMAITRPPSGAFEPHPLREREEDPDKGFQISRSPRVNGELPSHSLDPSSPESSILLPSVTVISTTAPDSTSPPSTEPLKYFPWLQLYLPLPPTNPVRVFTTPHA